MRWIMLACLMLPGAALAQEVVAEETVVLPAALANVDGRLAKQLQRDAGDVVEDAMSLILGFGRDGGIDRAGIAQSLDVERARLRAGVLRRMAEADLDADGTVTTAEIAVIAGAAEARYRGRVMFTHAEADGDGDGRVTDAEARARAQAVAMDAVSATDGERIMTLLGLDLDADGILTLTELREVARLMDSAP